MPFPCVSKYTLRKAYSEEHKVQKMLPLSRMEGCCAIWRFKCKPWKFMQKSDHTYQGC